jgi:enamine deaminase RidA (YjgF/YER057c/UK114 family)
VSGTTGTRPDGTVPERVEEQTRLALDMIASALEPAGASLAGVVMLRMYVTEIDEWERIASVLRERFASIRPAMSMVQVARLIHPAHRIEIEAEAVVGNGR